MKKLLLSLSVFICLFLAVSLIFNIESDAEDILGKNSITTNIKSENKEVAATHKDKCENAKQTITSILMEDVECFADPDCRYFDYGYPWQPAPCIKAVVSTFEEEKTVDELSLIENYNEECIYKDEKEMAKYKEMQELNEKTSCDLNGLICLQGKCRARNYLSAVERPNEDGNYR